MASHIKYGIIAWGDTKNTYVPWTNINSSEEGIDLLTTCYTIWAIQTILYREYSPYCHISFYIKEIILYEILDDIQIIFDPSIRVRRSDDLLVYEHNTRKREDTNLA